jgi:hypothetical protein
MSDFILETEKHSDGSMHRRFICSCGKVIYKKNLATGEYTLEDKNYKSKLLPGGDQGEYTFPCDCGIGHIVRNIKEGITTVDKI